MNLEKEYLEIKGDYDDFLKEFKRIVKKIMTKNGIPTAFEINGRLKSLDSINEKITLEGFKIKRHITELNDLVGLRIVLLYPEFKDKVVKVLTSEFKLLRDKNKSNQSPDKFGYSSIHLILQINEEWAKMPDWENHGNKKIEIQIRTGYFGV